MGRFNLTYSQGCKILYPIINLQNNETNVFWQKLFLHIYLWLEKHDNAITGTQNSVMLECFSNIHSPQFSA